MLATERKSNSIAFVTREQINRPAEEIVNTLPTGRAFPKFVFVEVPADITERTASRLIRLYLDAIDSVRPNLWAPLVLGIAGIPAVQRDRFRSAVARRGVTFWEGDYLSFCDRFAR